MMEDRVKGLRILVLGVAMVAAFAAVMVVQSALKSRQAAAVVQLPPPPPPPPEIPKTDVLVAARDMRVGETLNPQDLRWQTWPKDAIAPTFITKDVMPDAREASANSVLRNDIFAGEPIADSKLMKLDNVSLMAAMLRPGMRAISVKISAETGAGGFILPGDFVDVMLTRQIEYTERDDNDHLYTRRYHTTETFFESVRVLAIDQLFGDAQQQSALGRTATLELAPEQSEIVSLAEAQGNITLTLRSMSELLDENGVRIEDPFPQTVIDFRAEIPKEEEETEEPEVVVEAEPEPEEPESKEVIMIRGGKPIIVQVQ